MLAIQFPEKAKACTRFSSVLNIQKKSVYTLFFCTKYTEDGFLTNHIKGEKYNEKTDLSLSAGAGHADRRDAGHGSGGRFFHSSNCV